MHLKSLKNELEYSSRPSVTADAIKGQDKRKTFPEPVSTDMKSIQPQMDENNQIEFQRGTKYDNSNYRKINESHSIESSEDRNFDTIVYKRN